MLCTRLQLLATMKLVWPECVAQDMSPIECKFFIDDEILTLFTENDKFIRSRIIRKRSTENECYNAAVIEMDDNDQTLGRDSNGWIYYTL